MIVALAKLMLVDSDSATALTQQTVDGVLLCSLLSTHLDHDRSEMDKPRMFIISRIIQFQLFFIFFPSSVTTMQIDQLRSQR